jgi:glycosyltransferase involved in cell wall biosynthesis
MNNLAVVIPAYKEEYFSKALESFMLQTNNDFTIYVGDDCSPYDLESIVNNYKDKINIVYKKFDNNIGSKNIVSQWKRCVDLSSGEKWIWLFSDDDLVDSNAVENFYSILHKNKNRFDVYRFNTCVIDKYDNLISKSPTGPDEESSESMAYNLLLGLRGNSMPDHIFSRDVYNRNGGFVMTEYAQAADWATSILFSKEKGICIIPESIMFWRMSGDNISSIAKNKSREMFLGHLQFVAWLFDHFQYLENSRSAITYAMIKQASLINLRSVVLKHYGKLDNYNVLLLFSQLRNKFGMSYRDCFRFIYSIKRETDSRVNIVVNFIKKNIFFKS